jgi:hypothetical protein
MNRNRKIQLTAATVIANGALAFGLLSSSPALAATCNPITTCAYFGLNQCFLSLGYCRALTPPGCTFRAYYCAGGCTGGAAKVTCYYQ